MIEIILVAGFVALVIAIHDAGAGIINALFDIAELMEREHVRREVAAQEDQEDAA